MPCERQFFLDGKNADSDSPRVFGGGFTGQNESCLGKVGLTSQGLHLLGTQAAAVNTNS